MSVFTSGLPTTSTQFCFPLLAFVKSSLIAPVTTFEVVLRVVKSPSLAVLSAYTLKMKAGLLARKIYLNFILLHSQ
ncbi:hypothetical protein KPL44_22485 [Clostridium sp. DSM 17811]|uniref:hypothetical protein n=1 Tax=Clostridium sp. DSM 17811 TaxID=2843317 RepID=UPI001C0E4170|nr:hypothetical protein [Clostridium sp. DSM 17811]MBU3102013.1 hypothetical protein [Clostridium sp. DSM 17811]